MVAKCFGCRQNNDAHDENCKYGLTEDQTMSADDMTITVLKIENHDLKKEVVESKVRINRIGKLAKRLVKELAEQILETKKWQKEALQQHPTPEAYQAVCDALSKHRAGVRELIDLFEESITDEARDLTHRLKKLIDEANNNE